MKKLLLLSFLFLFAIKGFTQKKVSVSSTCKVKIEGYKDFKLGKTTISSLIANGYTISKPQKVDKNYDYDNWFTNMLENGSENVLSFFGKMKNYEQYKLTKYGSINLVFKDSILVYISDSHLVSDEVIESKYGKTKLEKNGEFFVSIWNDGKNSICNTFSLRFSNLEYYINTEHYASSKIDKYLENLDNINQSKNY